MTEKRRIQSSHGTVELHLNYVTGKPAVEEVAKVTIFSCFFF